MRARFTRPPDFRPPPFPPWLWQRPLAVPAERFPRYVIPCSHCLDPPYGWMRKSFPLPRQPWPWESESRAPGTGLIWGKPRRRCRCGRLRW